MAYPRAYLAIHDFEERKLAMTHDAAIAIAALLGFDSFRIVGDKIRFSCSPMPAITKTQTRTEEIITPIQQSNLSRSRALRLRPDLYSELDDMPSLYDIRMKPEEQKRTVNTKTVQVSYTPPVLVPIDLVIPADYRNTTTKEIYNCLKQFFEQIMKQIDSTDPAQKYLGNLANVDHLKDAAMCFLNADPKVEAHSGLLMPIHGALRGILPIPDPDKPGYDKTYLGLIPSLQYYNADPSTPDAQLARFIKNNSLLMFNNPQLNQLMCDTTFFNEIMKLISAFVTRATIEAGYGGDKITQKRSFREKMLDFRNDLVVALNEIADAIIPPKPNNNGRK